MFRNIRALVLFYSLTAFHQAESIAFFENITWWWDNTTEEITTHEQTLTPGCSISLSNKKGNITVSTWNKNKLLIETTKRGTDEEIKLTKVETLYTKKGASIKTIPLKTNRVCTVDYHLIIPQTALLTMVETDKGSITIKDVTTQTKVHAENGPITLDGVSNSVQASTKNGSIYIIPQALKATDRITALADRGTIQITLPAEAHAHLYARTNKGMVTSDHVITLEPRTLKICQASLAELKRDVRGTLGHGGATIKLQTSRGNVKVVEAA